MGSSGPTPALASPPPPPTWPPAWPPPFPFTPASLSPHPAQDGRPRQQLAWRCNWLAGRATGHRSGRTQTRRSPDQLRGPAGGPPSSTPSCAPCPAAPIHPPDQGTSAAQRRRHAFIKAIVLPYACRVTACTGCMENSGGKFSSERIPSRWLDSRLNHVVGLWGLGSSAKEDCMAILP